MISADAIRSLRTINWDFALPRTGYIGPPHWYPGTFIPAISDAIIEAVSPARGTVFDPYGGIGTTGWSAIRRGRSCLLADVNPVAVLVSCITTSLLLLNRVDHSVAALAIAEVARVVGRDKDLFHHEREMPVETVGIDKAHARCCHPSAEVILRDLVIAKPNWESLSGWVAGETLSQLRSLFADVDSLDSAFARLIGLCMVSAIVRSVSSQNSSWGHIADNVKPKKLTIKDVRKAAWNWLQKMKKFLSQTSGLRPVKAGEIALELWRCDWCHSEVEPKESADLLLTSPPYADAIDYTLSQRLSLYLLGHSDAGINRLVTSEIGARRKRFQSASRTKWAEQLCGAMREQLRWVKPTGSVCLILPHKDSGRDNGVRDIKGLLVGLGWEPVFERDRSIHQSHTRQSWTSIKQETIVVFSRAEES